MGNGALVGLQLGRGKATEERLRAVWAHFDQDGSGVLERREAERFFDAWMRANLIIPTEARRAALWDTLDANEDERLTIEEVVAAAGSESGTPSENSTRSQLKGRWKQDGWTLWLWENKWVVEHNGHKEDGHNVEWDIDLLGRSEAIESDEPRRQVIYLRGEGGYRLKKNEHNLWVLLSAEDEVLVTFEASAFSEEY